MPNMDDISEIFSHIEQIKKEKKKTDEIDEEPIVESLPEEIITVKKSDGKEIDENIVDSEKMDDAKIEEEKISEDPVNLLDESIKKINQVSRMTPDHFEFKTTDEQVSPSREISNWDLPGLQTGTCDLCGETIEFEKNLSGLTVAGNFFACEKCCINSSKEELSNWTKSKMRSPADVRPIGLWVIQEKNKNRSILFRKK